jgi:hypothetical protein
MNRFRVFQPVPREWCSQSRDFAKALVTEFREGRSLPSRSRSGRRGTASDLPKQARGKIGECAVALYFGLDPAASVKWGVREADKGGDVILPCGTILDAKTTFPKYKLIWSNDINDLFDKKKFDALEHRAAGKLAKGTKGNLAGKRKGTSKGKGKGKGSSGGVAKTPPEEASLAKQGVTKELAKQARKAAAMAEEKFEAGVKKSVAVAVASAGGANEVVKAARAENHKKQQAKRAEREGNLAAKIAALPSKKYGVIYADPEWKFEFYSEAGKDISSAVYDPRDTGGIRGRCIASALTLRRPWPLQLVAAKYIYGVGSCLFAPKGCRRLAVGKRAPRTRSKPLISKQKSL